MKNSFQNVVKRISAGFMASVVFAYSLLIAPCFGVGAVNFDVAEWFKSVGSAAISIATGGSTVASLVGTLLMNVGIEQVQSRISTEKPNGFEISQPLANISSFAGNATIDGHDAVVTVYTRPATTFTYTDLWYDYSNGDPVRFKLCNAVWDGGSRAFYFSIIPRDGDSNSWQDNDTCQIYYTYNYHASYPGIYCSISFKDSSGASISRNYSLIFYSIYYTGATYTKTSPVLYGNFKSIGLLADYSNKTYDDFLSLVPSNYNTNPIYVCGQSQSVGSDSHLSLAFPEIYGDTFISNITNENYYDYLNKVSYPYTVNTYPQWQVLSPPPDYVIPDPTEEPTEEPTESTGTGAVIIIDPFTLPPDWVESDVVELNTEAYTIDYDIMIDEPLDEINYPLTPTNPLSGGANILSFGIQFLKDGGVFYIICTLLVIGLLIRFLGI